MTAERTAASEPAPVSAWPPASWWPVPIATQQRVGELLETSRRSVGRAVEADLVAAPQNPAVVTEARTVLAASARRGSTGEERAAAGTWLADVLRDE